MKVALVCDWLTNVGGAEKVLLELHRLYPEAPIYTSQYDPAGIDWFSDADVRTGYLQKYPSKLRRLFGAKRQKYFEKLDLSEYDLVISVTGAEAKAVKVPNGIHICYCHVPTQYYWQMYKDYMKNPGFGVLNPLVRLGFRVMVRPLRKADYRAAQGPDCFVTISEYAKEMIAKYYNREATVIHPPVEVEEFKPEAGVSRACPSEVKGLEFLGCHTLDRGQNRPDGRTCPGRQEYTSQKSKSGLGSRPQKDTRDYSPRDYYITTSRQVNWKRIDLAVKACMMTQRRLLVVGEGPEHKKLVKMAKGCGLIEFVPLVDKARLAELLAGARGYLFPSLEPFGIAPVEALAAGCPVIAYGKGGALDYVKDGTNGILFESQTAKSLAEAILAFEKMNFSRSKVAESVKKFGVQRFDTDIKNFVKKCEKKHAKA